MTTLYFVRHGESRANVEKVFTGQTDVPLSARGMRQAEELKERLLALKPDAFFSSDLLRAVQTVTPAAKALGLAVRPEKGLREIDGGLWEGKHIDEIARAYPKDYACWMEDIGLARCTGGESLEEVQARGLAAVLRIAKENDGKAVVLATHAAMIRTLTCAFRGLPLSEMQHIPFVPNASLSEVRFERGAFTIVSYADVSFLGSDVTRLPEDI